MLPSGSLLFTLKDFMTKQRIAVVTGASSGFGRLTAEAFAADGWRTYATMRNTGTKNAKVAADLLRAGISVVELDVTSNASVDAAAKIILDATGSVDVLVNNAGTAFFGIQEAYTPEAAERQYATNVIGPLRVNRAFLPAMRERKSGLVVYVSSVVGRVVLPYSSIYSSSKWALEALAEASFYELSPFGIDVAIVEPGAYATEILGKTEHADDAARVETYGRFAQLAEDRIAGLAVAAEGRDPAEVAKAILRLANAPQGTRELRTVVPENPVVEGINNAAAPLQRGLLEAMDMGELLAKVPA
jgi:NAD(P)-dependent dehydrogenase (short-subunit alcohol dehydrogenase family)